MKNKIYYPLAISFLALTINGCASLDTNLSIPEKAIPASFQNQKNTATTIADINWRQYFTDPLLVKLIDTAVANNLDLQMALQRIEVSRSSVKLANGALLPKVDLSIGGGVQKFGLYTMDGAGNASTEITPGQIVPENLTDLFLGLQASWEVDVWGKLRSQRKAAIEGYLSSIEGTHFVISNLVADVAVNYNELLALDNELDIIRQTIQKQQEALEVVKLQKEAGRANELAVQQFRAQLLNTQALEKQRLQQITEAENRLNFLLGRYPQPIERKKEVLFEAIPQQIASGVPSQLLANRPDVREAEHQIEASKFDLKAARAAFFPNFNITATLGYQAFNPEFLFQTPASLAYSLFGTVVAPLINMNALKAQFNTAKANQLTAMYNYQKTILNGYVEVSNELANIKNLEQIHAQKKQQSEALKKSIETSDELYKSARATYLEVLIAQQNALQANLELIDVTKRQRISTVKIYKALGGGWS
ncbi:efflux transporter outer membrane subunit [Methylobacter sp. BlB1]|uniref:efflux transporter outer membrane subunit n=1 Tax=Methylobacter sp. BlB1 TaxID=2785914 RepID=UPI0018949FD9|nr:efflux transporter outer membrane subunit [Methylobacter sp. BlB1]MBF6648227.1 efflux transporter outer membrane subunit [Methylobacter sp. BlB1]